MILRSVVEKTAELTGLPKGQVTDVLITFADLASIEGPEWKNTLPQKPSVLVSVWRGPTQFWRDLILALRDMPP